jgi:hypothetical protein
LVALLKKRLAVAASLYTVLQVLDVSLFEKTDLTPLLRRADAAGCVRDLVEKTGGASIFER